MLYNMCECCSLALTNDDTTACESYYAHDAHALTALSGDTFLSPVRTYEHAADTWECDGCRQWQGPFATLYMHADPK